jgi:hypothetical protein
MKFILSFFALLNVASLCARQATIMQDSTRIDSTVQNVEQSSLLNGTIIYFTLDEDLDATDISKGSTIDFTVRTDVKFNGKTVIEKGAIAEGEIAAIEYNDDNQPISAKIQLNNVQNAEGMSVLIQSKTEVFRFSYEKGDKGMIMKGKNMSGKIITSHKNNEMSSKEQPIINNPAPTKTKVNARLYNGTTIDLETTQAYKVENLEQGKTISLRVLTPVKVNGQVVIAYEAIATAEFAQITTTAFGKEVEIKILEVTAVDGQKIPLKGTFEYNEKDFSRKIELQAYTRSTTEFTLWK